MVIGSRVFIPLLLAYVQICSSVEHSHTTLELPLGPGAIETKYSYKEQSRLRRVVGGEESNNVFHFMGGLLQGSCEVKCGVAILDRLHVITAAHCIKAGIQANKLKILVGTPNLQDCVKNPTKLVPVMKVTVHPNYKGGHQGDIAILKLAVPLDFSTGRVKAVTLQTSMPPPSSRVKFLGWGSTNSRIIQNSVTLRKGESTIMTSEECMGRIRSRLDGSQFCIKHRSAVPCKGDSGGPVIIEDHSRGTYFLVGVISTGPEGCRLDVPSICSSIAAYNPWIKQTISQNSNAI